MNVIKTTEEPKKRTGTLEACEKLFTRAAVVVSGVLGVLLTYKIFEGLFALVAFLFTNI